MKWGVRKVTKDPEHPSVVHVFSTLDRGGAEQRTLEAIRGQPQGATDQGVITLSGRGGELEELFRGEGVAIRYARIGSLRFLRRFPCFLRERRATAVHSHVAEYSGVTLVLARLCRVPVRIVHFRSDGVGRPLSRRAQITDSILRRMIDWAATDIVGVSPGALSHGWRENWREDPRCRVLLSGLDLGRFGGPLNVDQARRMLGLTGQRRAVLHVGRCAPAKNRERAIQIFAHLAQRDDDLRLIFAGRESAEDLDELSSLAKRLGVEPRVKFLGELPEVADVMRVADLLLMTSRYEGLPGVVLEARAAGLPVLASEIPGTQFLAQRLDGITTMALTDSDELWADAAFDLLRRHPTPQTRRAALDALYGTEFDLNQAAQHYLALWRA